MLYSVALAVDTKTQKIKINVLEHGARTCDHSAGHEPRFVKAPVIWHYESADINLLGPVL